MTELIGKTLDERYRFEARIGEGTFANVYRVHDSKRSVDLAAKVLRTDIAHEPAFIERFRRESEVLARLQHPHIVRYYDLIEVENYTFILMDYVPGVTLQRTLYELARPFIPTETLKFLEPLAAALHYAHDEGVIHRDLKPANILLHENGNLLVTDFGIARLIDNAAIAMTTGTALGTPLYMAPEQINSGEITPQTDIYSLGILLYQMLTNTLPFLGKHPHAKGLTTSERVTYEQLHIAPQSPRIHVNELSTAIEETILRCLEKDPAKRPQTIREVFQMLAGALSDSEQPIGAKSLAKVSTTPLPGNIRLPELSQFIKPDFSSKQEIESDESPNRKSENKEAPAVTSSAVASSKYNPASDNTVQPSEYAESTILSPSTPNPHKQITLPHGTPIPVAPSTTPPALTSASSEQRGPNIALFAMFGAGLVIIAFTMLIIYALTFERNASTSPGNPERTAATNDSAPTSTLSETENSEIAVPGDVVSPTASMSVRSDGSKIAFASHRSGSLKIYISDSDGSNTRQLTHDETLDETGPAWSPGGQRIAFYAYGNDGFADIYLINADGSGRQNLTNSPDENDRYVSWSPDGQHLLFHSDRPGSDGSTDFELYSYSLDNGTIQQLTFNKVADLGGDWSPDGQKIAFHSYEGGVAYIYTMNIDGTNRQRLSPEDIGGAFFPTWSPDGKAIAFHVNEGEFFQIYVMDSLDGSNLHPLMDEVFNDQFPDWSPSGDFVIFQREKETNVRGEIRLVMGIYRYDVTSNSVKLISSNLGDFLPDWQSVSP